MSNMLRFYFSMFLELERKFSFMDRHYLYTYSVIGKIYIHVLVVDAKSKNHA